MPWSWACGECKLLIQEPGDNYVTTYNLGDAFPITVPTGTKIGAIVTFNYEIPAGSAQIGVAVCSSEEGCIGFTASFANIPDHGTYNMSVNPLVQNTVTIRNNTNIEVVMGYLDTSGVLHVIISTGPLPVIVAEQSEVEIWHYSDYNFIREKGNPDITCTHPMVPPCEIPQNKDMYGYLYYRVTGIDTEHKDLKITLQKRNRTLGGLWSDITYTIVNNIWNGDNQLGFDFDGESVGIFDYRWKFQIKNSSSSTWESLPDEQAYPMEITVHYIVGSSICTPGETRCVDNYLQRCSSYGQWEETSEYCGPTVCTPGAEDCNGPGGTRRECNQHGQWVNTGEPCETPECVAGTTDCNGPNNTRRVCSAGGEWVNTGESCGTPQECDPINEPYKCVDCGLFRCNNGHWEPMSDPPLIEHVKYCGIQCNTLLIASIIAVAAVGTLGAYLYYKKRKGE